MNLYFSNILYLPMILLNFLTVFQTGKLHFLVNWEIILLWNIMSTRMIITAFEIPQNQTLGRQQHKVLKATKRCFGKKEECQETLIYAIKENVYLRSFLYASYSAASMRCAALFFYCVTLIRHLI